MMSSKSFKLFSLLTAIILLLIVVYFILSYPIKTWDLPSISKAIAFSSDGTMLATGAGETTSYSTSSYSATGVSSTVEIRRVADAKVIQELNFPNATSIAFSPGNRLIAAGNRGIDIKVWQISDGKLVSTFKQSDFKQSGIDLSFVEYLAFTPDSKTLVSFTQKYSSSSKNRPDTIDVWNIDSGGSRRILSKNFSCVSISPNKELLAIGGRDKVEQFAPLSIYELENGTLSKVFDRQPKGCRQIQFSKDSKLLSFFNFDQKKIDIYYVENGKLIRSQNIKYIERKNLLAGQIAFSQDANYLAIAYSAASIEGGFIFPSIPKTFFGRIRIWNTENGRLVKTLLRSNKGSNALAFSPDGKFIASAEKDKTIRLWKIPSNNYSWLWLLSAGGLIALVYWRRKDLKDWIIP